MISASDEFKQQLDLNNHDYLLNVNIVLKDNTVLQTITKDQLFEFTIEDAISKDSKFEPFGGAVINQATLVIANYDEQYSDYDFIDAVVTLQLGLILEDLSEEYIDKGVYTVDSANIRNSSIELICLDNMSKFDRPYSDTSISSYPVTVQEAVEDACEVCGVTLSGSIPYSTDELNIVPKSVSTFREVIHDIAQITGTFARINTSGELYFSWFNKDALISAINNPDLIVSGVHYINQVQSIIPDQSDITITGVHAYVMRELERFEYSSGEQNFSIDLSGNVFLTSTNIQTVLDRLAVIVNGLCIRGLTANHVNNPLYEAGDVGMITYKKRNDEIQYSPFIFTRTRFSVNKFQETVCGIETVLENQSNRYSNAQKVTAEAQAFADYASRVATHYLSVDDSGIMVANLATERQTPSNATGRNVFIDADSVDVRDGQSVLASFGETTVIGKEEDAHIEAVGNRLSFKVGLSEVAYIAVDEETQESVFYMTKAIVVQDLYFGSWQWKSRNNGNLALKWVGEEV